ncbi:hypothetical protein L1049_014282 [Liquidambar formosana]|uniref:Uncharacterized protein n=1 Tax=Liquidambar formosana TaxID=63359 RepID=A0AAP0RN19_LIQFO
MVFKRVTAIPKVLYSRIVKDVNLDLEVAEVKAAYLSLIESLKQREKYLKEPLNPTPMATRVAARYISRRLSSSGKILSEEEKAAENVYIKKIEQEKLEKLARKGPKPEENTVTSSGGSAADVKPSAPASSTSRVSTDKYRNYAVVAGVVTGFGALGWYLKSSAKKPELQE